jgi:hypothetical protein
MDAEVDAFSIEGTGEFAAGGVLVLDETLESLGPYAVEAAVLAGEYENEPCELVVAPTTESGATALSHHRLDQIKPMLRELSPAFCPCCSYGSGSGSAPADPWDQKRSLA